PRDPRPLRDGLRAGLRRAPADLRDRPLRRPARERHRLARNREGAPPDPRALGPRAPRRRGPARRRGPGARRARRARAPRPHLHGDAWARAPAADRARGGDPRPPRAQYRAPAGKGALRAALNPRRPDEAPQSPLLPGPSLAGDPARRSLGRAA